MKCEAIYAHSPNYSVRKMCKSLGVHENQYYRWIRAAEKRRKRREAEQYLVDEVVKQFEASNKIYGYRNLWKEVVKTTNISEWKVRKIMRENGLYSICCRK